MKYLMLALLFLASHGLFAQEKASAAMNYSPVLTDAEVTALNRDFDTIHPRFDFHDKKIAFVSGSMGKSINTKEAYFSTKLQMGGIKAQQLLILDEAEKKASGGYDALVIYYVKTFPRSSRRYVIKQLGKDQWHKRG